jgi:hypothetical protein
LAAIFGLCLLLAGCDGSEDPPGPDETPAASEPGPIYARPTPSDGGTVEITETGYTILDQSDSRFVQVVWGATFQNASQTDLLAKVDFQVTWRSADGETEELRTTDGKEQLALDVLPGGTAVIGREYFVGFVPDSLDVTVRTSEWAPMVDLQAYGLPVGVEVTSYRIDVGSDVRVQVGFTSAYEGRPGRDDDLRITVALRDAGGGLLGAMLAEPDFGAGVVPGEREQVGTFREGLRWWPDQADPDTSQAMIVKVGSAWVGVA